MTKQGYYASLIVRSGGGPTGCRGNRKGWEKGKKKKEFFFLANEARKLLKTKGRCRKNGKNEPKTKLNEASEVVAKSRSAIKTKLKMELANVIESKSGKKCAPAHNPNPSGPLSTASTDFPPVRRAPRALGIMASETDSSNRQAARLEERSCTLKSANLKSSTTTAGWFRAAPSPAC